MRLQNSSHTWLPCASLVPVLFQARSTAQAAVTSTLRTGEKVWPVRASAATPICGWAQTRSSACVLKRSAVKTRLFSTIWRTISEVARLPA